MTLYRLLHGKAWYEEGAAPRTVVKNGGYADTLRWLPHVPKAWRRLIRKMLNDDDAARFQNAAQTLKAMANVPALPNWQAGVAVDLVRWEQIRGARRIVVEWRRHSPRKHEWTAWSEPIGKGQNKTLAGSDGSVGRAEAVKGLEAFFDA